MKLIVNARFLSQPYTGIAEYTEHLVRALAEENPDWEITLLQTKKIEISFPHNVKQIILNEPNLFSAGLNKSYWEQVTLRKYINNNPADIYWSPYFSMPFALPKKLKTIVTIHDAIPWQMKKYQHDFTSRLYHFFNRITTTKATKILTVSEYSKRQIIKFLKIKTEKISVVYNAVSPEFISNVSIDLPKKYGLSPNKYYVYLGGYDRRKNVQSLVENYQRAEKLVLIGTKDEKFKTDYTILLEKLTTKEVKSVLKNSLGLIHLSTLEGFNIPILEAMNCNIPILASDIPVNREIYQNSLFYLNIKELDTLNRTIDKFEKQAAEQVKKYKKIISQYSWQKSAKLLTKIIQETCN